MTFFEEHLAMIGRALDSMFERVGDALSERSSYRGGWRDAVSEFSGSVVEWFSGEENRTRRVVGAGGALVLCVLCVFLMLRSSVAEPELPPLTDAQKNAKAAAQAVATAPRVDAGSSRTPPDKSRRVVRQRGAY